jgi:hypothetical protein
VDPTISARVSCLILFLALCHCRSSFRFNSNLHRRACVEAYRVIIFVLQHVLDADLSIRSSAPFIAICAFSGSFGCGDSIIVSTIPGKVVLGRCVAIFQQPNLDSATTSEQKGTLG